MNIIRGAAIEYTPASHEKPEDPGVLKKVLVSRDDIPPGRVQMVNWSKMPIGGRFQNHYHESLTEVFVITKGRVKGTVGDSEVELNEGDALVVEPHERHTLTNITDEEVYYVVFGVVHADGGRTIITEDQDSSGR